MRFPRPRTRPRSLAGQLFAMQVVLVAAVVAGCAFFAYVSGSGQAKETATRQVTAAALAVADSPSVREAIRTPDPSAVLQPYAEKVRGDTGIAFVTIMSPQRVRWTHPDTNRIGEEFLGHTARALRGETFTETYTGTLGPSIRVVTPVRDGGRITGLVSAGITVDRVSSQVRAQLGALGLAAGGALALGGIGTYVINARLRRHTHGMNAAELSRMHDYHQATLHAVREGLLMLDGQRRIALINDAGRELLGLEPGAVGRRVAELDLPARLTGALLASEERVDELHLTADRVIVVSTRPVVGGEQRGTVVTLRDHTELQALSGELDSERGFTQALRSQAHEAANRLHTVVSLIELGRAEEAVGFATAELELAQTLTDRVVGAVAEPVLAALLLGKAAQANERGVELVLADDSLIDDGALHTTLPHRDLVTILGNLIDNAVDAASEAATDASGTGAGAAGTGDGVAVPAQRGATGPGRAARARVTVTALAEEGELLLRVADTGAGINPADAAEVFDRGWSTHGAGRGIGLALVQQAVHRNGGTVALDRGPDGGAEFTVRLPLAGGGRTTHTTKEATA
ncbi:MULTISPECIES: sensor histidine kinase [unclassified Streptomyces]|uniref:sensor histidine kinase n=1 Tax=unclassified Streptomyces TaxID=2593676 RepID=UPI002254630F|nr:MULTISPECIES: ATP-binding protein [unclassified Streptomyces]MCX4789458.1 ATP-binding protein [Streptomyces sp. NBC_01221]MCX4794821.1 ATP-binding protein [Streptomyces sp. NBC_01242]WSP62587.1 ATP-binding protein [Streptomyces sp. NBC_01240]WSU21674.1 ATP-binding protein [Streptomyces sp. NBC_01108]